MHVLDRLFSQRKDGRLGLARPLISMGRRLGIGRFVLHVLLQRMKLAGGFVSVVSSSRLSAGPEQGGGSSRSKERQLSFLCAGEKNGQSSVRPLSRKPLYDCALSDQFVRLTASSGGYAFSFFPATGFGSWRMSLCLRRTDVDSEYTKQAS